MKSLIVTVAKIKTSFSEFSDAILFAFVSAVYAALEGSSDFPLTQVLLPNLNDTNNSFKIAMDNAQGLGKVVIQIKNNLRQDLISILRQVSYSVVLEANGDRELLLKSAFQLQKDRTPAVFVAPKGTSLIDGSVAGKMEFVIEGGRNLKSIAYKITPDPLTEASVWSVAASTKRKHVFQGLQSQKKYWACVQIGSNETEYISNPISRVAQ